MCICILANSRSSIMVLTTPSSMRSRISDLILCSLQQNSFRNCRHRPPHPAKARNPQRCGASHTVRVVVVIILTSMSCTSVYELVFCHRVEGTKANFCSCKTLGCQARGNFNRFAGESRRPDPDAQRRYAIAYYAYSTRNTTSW